MQTTIAILPGDGIGTEVTREAVKALTAVAQKFGHEFDMPEGLIGGAGLDAEDNPFPDSTAAICADSAAVLLGAVGGPKWDNVPTENRPERGRRPCCALPPAVRSRRRPGRGRSAPWGLDKDGRRCRDSERTGYSAHGIRDSFRATACSRILEPRL